MGGILADPELQDHIADPGSADPSRPISPTGTRDPMEGVQIGR
jgi:hypothetical protein